MRRTIALARQVAQSNATVLIRGEIGTGKGRLARAIHAWSGRASGAFASVSCDTTSADELDAELFGFTKFDAPARLDVPGRIEFCKGGTIALHDITHAPPSLQPKLVRLLADKEFERHEDFQSRPADVRVVAATSVDPDEAVRRGRLRRELLLLLDVVRVEIPPLRQRPEDVRMLARRYLAHFSRENQKRIAGIATDAMTALKKYPWPGNTRELRNLLERAVILCNSDEIRLEHFPSNLLAAPQRHGIGDLVPLDTIEDLHIRRVLASTGSIKGAAAVLGIGVSTMVRWMKRANAGQAPPEDASVVPTVHAGAEHEKPAG